MYLVIHKTEDYMPIIIDLTGQRFGKLVVIRFLGRDKKHSMFQCLCDCGGLAVVTSNNLRREHTTSCGCQSSRKTIGERTGTHGLSKHPLFESWIGMRNRCYWQGHNRWEHYGGKGIEVCEQWRDDFEAFYAWGKANGWERGLSIDRKDNNKNYSPDNCKFSTQKEQNRNRTSNVKLTVDGVTKILIEWSEFIGIHPTTIKGRIKRGWDVKAAIFTPIKSKTR